jgi:hypothetical protein
MKKSSSRLIRTRRQKFRPSFFHFHLAQRVRRLVNGEAWGSGLLWARVVAAVGISGGLLAVVAGAYFARGFEDASRLFLLLQGVILSTLAFLFATQATDRAEQAVATESRRRAIAESAADTELQIAREDLLAARQAIDRLLADPDVGRKVEAVLRSDQEG